MDVANDIRQLKRQAQFFRQFQRARIAETENVRARQANRAGHAVTIFAQALERRVRPGSSGPSPRR